MPETTHRDQDETASALAAWLEDHLPGASGVTVGGIEAPPTNGFSSETIMFEASWHAAGGAEVARRLVARVAPTGHTVFLEPDFAAQCRVVDAVARSGAVPLPRLVGTEEDPSLLGAPFLVMERVDGRIPTDNPPFAAGGWVVDAAPEEQERMWWSGIEAMAAVHRLHWGELGLQFLDDSRWGRAGVDRELGYYRAFLDWVCGDDVPPVVAATLSWLEDNRPAEAGPLALLWGDSRLGNLIFDDFRCVAVLDWEMTCLGQPEMDLGWWLYFDRQFTTALGMARPGGFPTREETIRRYEELLGRPMVGVEFYEVFAGFRFAVIMARLAELLQETDILPMDSDMGRDNIATQLLAEMLDLPRG
ncbi:MAG: phosphotransferase family protein [Actinomycetota bacterium]|nr:phosphotransferase family protein [Actinomycetota bacterium]